MYNSIAAIKNIKSMCIQMVEGNIHTIWSTTMYDVPQIKHYCRMIFSYIDMDTSFNVGISKPLDIGRILDYYINFEIFYKQSWPK
jgi:hypothetical protein